MGNAFTVDKGRHYKDSFKEIQRYLQGQSIFSTAAGRTALRLS